MDYALSRLQARFGERPDDSLWQELEAVSAPAAALEISRACGLRRWVAGIAPQDDRHAIEIVLRAHWRDFVAEISSWMPSAWQPSVAWARGLVDLPALAYLARGGPPLPWMFADPVLQIYVSGDTARREARLRAACGLLPASSARSPAYPHDRLDQGSSGIGQAWIAEWRKRWPRWSDAGPLEHLAGLFESAVKQPAALGRPCLLLELRKLLRRSVLRPVAVFVYMALFALDIERLRAGLLKPDLARAGIIPS